MAITDNLLAYWKLDANGSAVSLADSSGNGRTLTAPNGTNGLSLGAGKVGTGSASFSGDESTYLKSSFNPVRDAFSCSFWFKISNFSILIGGSNSGELAFDLSFSESFTDQPRFLVTTDSGNEIAQGTTQVGDGQWHHMVGTFNRYGNITLYIDGTQDEQITASGASPVGSTDGVGINAYPVSNFGRGLAGVIDEVGFWGRELSASEVTLLYNNGDGRSVSQVGNTPQSIAAFSTIADRISGSAPFTIDSPTASSGLAVVFSVKSGPATISGNTLTLTGTTGTVVIAANQYGNATYAAAAEVTTSFEVGRAGWWNEKFWIGGVETTLPESGTGWWNEKFWIGGVETTLPESGTGYWNEKFYIGGTETTLPESGTGWWNEKLYLAGDRVYPASALPQPSQVIAGVSYGQGLTGTAVAQTEQINLALLLGLPPFVQI